MSMRVLVVDDEKCARYVARRVLEYTCKGKVRVVGEARNGEEGLRLARKMKPDIVLMDVQMRDFDGIWVTQELHFHAPEIKVIALTVHEEEAIVRQMFMAGAAGYVLKGGIRKDLPAAIEAIGKGKRYVSPGVAGVVNLNSCGEDIRGNGESMLGPRERQTLQLLVVGDTSDKSGKRLCLAPGTVETYRKRIRKKTGFHDVGSLTKFAIREGLTSPDP